jgi:hypothetical protein
MNTNIKWFIGLAAAFLALLLLIGFVGLLMKFFVKRCRKKAWIDIQTLPKQSAVDGHLDDDCRKLKRTSSERQPLFVSSTNNALDVSDQHVSIPVDEHEPKSSRTPFEADKCHEHTLVQIQRDRLNRLKEEEERLRPMLRLSQSNNDIQCVISQAQKEFDQPV